MITKTISQTHGGALYYVVEVPVDEYYKMHHYRYVNWVAGGLLRATTASGGERLVKFNIL